MTRSLEVGLDAVAAQHHPGLDRQQGLVVPGPAGRAGRRAAAHPGHDSERGRELGHLGADHHHDGIDEHAPPTRAPRGRAAGRGPSGRARRRGRPRRRARCRPARPHRTGLPPEPPPPPPAAHGDPAASPADAAATRSTGHPARDRQLVGEPRTVDDAGDLGQLGPAPPGSCSSPKSDVQTAGHGSRSTSTADDRRPRPAQRRPPRASRSPTPPEAGMKAMTFPMRHRRAGARAAPSGIRPPVDNGLDPEEVWTTRGGTATPARQRARKMMVAPVRGKTKATSRDWHRGGGARSRRRSTREGSTTINGGRSTPGLQTEMSRHAVISPDLSRHENSCSFRSAHRPEIVAHRRRPSDRRSRGLQRSSGLPGVHSQSVAPVVRPGVDGSK